MHIRKITNVNLNQHAISSSPNEMTTPLLSPKNNRSCIENSHEDLIDLTFSSEEGSSLSSVHCCCSNSEHIDINLQESIIVNNHENEKASINSCTSASEGILRREKLISNLKPITKMWTFS